jgi:ankyrin repeat protein
MIEELIKLKYPLNETKKNGVTAFGLAAAEGHLSIVKLLLLAGADINIVSKTGISALNLAIKRNR